MKLWHHQPWKARYQPEGVFRNIDKPYAIVGSADFCDIRTPAGTPAVAYYLHRLPGAVEAWPLLKDIPAQCLLNGSLLRVDGIEIEFEVSDASPTELPNSWPVVQFVTRSQRQSVFLNQRITILGRALPSAIRIPEPSIAKCQLVLAWEGGRLWVINLYGGQGRVQTVTLDVGEQVSFKDLQIRFTGKATANQVSYLTTDSPRPVESNPRLPSVDRPAVSRGQSGKVIEGLAGTIASRSPWGLSSIDERDGQSTFAPPQTVRSGSLASVMHVDEVKLTEEGGAALDVPIPGTQQAMSNTKTSPKSSHQSRAAQRMAKKERKRELAMPDGGPPSIEHAATESQPLPAEASGLFQHADVGGHSGSSSVEDLERMVRKTFESRHMRAAKSRKVVLIALAAISLAFAIWMGRVIVVKLAPLLSPYSE